MDIWILEETPIQINCTSSRVFKLLLFFKCFSTHLKIPFRFREYGGGRLLNILPLWSWWWTGRPGVLRFMGSQRVGHDWATELNWTDGVILQKKKGGGDSEGDQISDKLFGVFSYIFIGVSVYLWCACLCMHACVRHACVHHTCACKLYIGTHTWHWLKLKM